MNDQQIRELKDSLSSFRKKLQRRGMSKVEAMYVNLMKQTVCEKLLEVENDLHCLGASVTVHPESSLVYAGQSFTVTGIAFVFDDYKDTKGKFKNGWVEYRLSLAGTEWDGQGSTSISERELIFKDDKRRVYFPRLYRHYANQKPPVVTLETSIK